MRSFRKPERYGNLMERLFFAFPRGWPAVALLLMRATIGLALLVQGGFYLREPDPAPATWAVGMSTILAAGLLLIGTLTPIVCSVVMIGALGIRLSLLPACTPSLFDSRAAAGFRDYYFAGDRGSRPRSIFCRRAPVRPPRNHFPSTRADSRFPIRSAAAQRARKRERRGDPRDRSKTGDERFLDSLTPTRVGRLGGSEFRSLCVNLLRGLRAVRAKRPAGCRARD